MTKKCLCGILIVVLMVCVAPPARAYEATTILAIVAGSLIVATVAVLAATGHRHKKILIAGLWSPGTKE